MTPQRRSDVKSEEEWRMVLWLREAVCYRLVLNWEYEPAGFPLFDGQSYTIMKQLKTKVKPVDKILHRPAVYTPDFRIMLTDFGMRLLGGYFEKALVGSSGTKTIYIDSKGSFNPYQNDQRYFSLVQKAMYDRHRIWPQKVIPFEKKAKNSLFRKTWAPHELRFMKNKNELNACGRECCSIVEFLNKELN